MNTPNLRILSAHKLIKKIECRINLVCTSTDWE